jgi:hypothetical protein
MSVATSLMPSARYRRFRVPVKRCRCGPVVGCYSPRVEGRCSGPSSCRYDHFLTDWYARWATAIGFNVSDRESPIHVHRKVWEWCAIAQAARAGSSGGGKRGCGFAVGREPLASLFAARGVDVLATDIGQEGADAW